jgi:DNA excision repair protein ERCC-3
LISRDTNEERFGQNRQLFLTEQGYEYQIYILDQFIADQEEQAVTV